MTAKRPDRRKARRAPEITTTDRQVGIVLAIEQAQDWLESTIRSCTPPEGMRTTYDEEVLKKQQLLMKFWTRLHTKLVAEYGLQTCPRCKRVGHFENCPKLLEVNAHGLPVTVHRGR